MYITNWLAKNGGLVLPSELARGNIRIYGNVYGNPNFPDGEYIQTGVIVSYNDGVVRTASGSEYTLVEKAPQYLNFLQALEKGLIIVKYWGVKNGNIIGKTLDGTTIEGKVISQNFKDNICRLEDGSKLFVDWLSKDPENNPDIRKDELLVFCTEKCMPDIIGRHFGVFKRRDGR